MRPVFFEPSLHLGSPDLPSLLFQRFVPVELAQELKVDVTMLSFIFTLLGVQPSCADSHPCCGRKTKVWNCVSDNSTRPQVGIMRKWHLKDQELPQGG